jgi:hypothetical protein
MRTLLPLAMPLVVEKTMVAWVLVCPGTGLVIVRLVVVVVPNPVGLNAIEYAGVEVTEEPVTCTVKGAFAPLGSRPVFATVIPLKVRVTVAPITHAPLLGATVSVRVFAEESIAPVIRAGPDMKALGAPARGIFPEAAPGSEKVNTRALPGAMVPAAPAVLNPMTKFWHVPLWHDGMETDVTWYPEMGPLGEPGELTASKLVETVMPMSLPGIWDPRVRPLMVTV